MTKGWHDWFGTFTGVAALTVAALPLAALTGWVLARRRRRTGATPAWAWRTSLAEVGLVYGTVPWVWMTLLPGSRAGAVPGRVSPVPLRDLLSILADAPPLTAMVQIVGNLLVFAALGFLAPLRFAALASVPRILALAAGCSVLIETAQYVLQLDRVSSVDDVLLNAAGAGLAALASRRWGHATEGGVEPVEGAQVEHESTATETPALDRGFEFQGVTANSVNRPQTSKPSRR
ncbi:VanZ family protein [Amycolatopsis rhizosphaerae]|uniref:VanZ family protein n=1 Tax=Amycolatopsis rhizosphaerae TaxID=2053003 RepID=A0A558CL35_9PSEU|nr:VanZ family protein [Amycolatopsis rhizosphaerae]TVT49442.1 VanZ family protein [Amycolatopsis rhizosphaerae]